MSFDIRPFRPADRQAIRDICAATAWAGRTCPERVPDDWLWAEYWTRYFTDIEPRYAWVAVRTGDDTVVGYLTGTASVRAFERYAASRLPAIVARIIRRRLIRRPPARRALLGLARSALRGELDVPRPVREAFPATWHINLLPETRGRQVGQRLFACFTERLAQRGVRGIHAQTLSINLPVTRYLQALGLSQVATSPLTAWQHLDLQPLYLHTWVKTLP